MQVLKCIIWLLVQLYFCGLSFSKIKEIDSLITILPSLRDSARVDCLNALSEHYLKLGNVNTTAYYAELAYEEAVKINFIHGIAEALSYKVEVEIFSDNFSEAEKLSHEAINWYRKTSNKKRLAEAHLYLGHSMHAQSNFQDAIRNVDTSIKLSSQFGDSLNNWLSLNLLIDIYHEAGDYERAFEKVMELHHFLIKYSNTVWKAYELISIGTLYRALKDYATALKYFTKAHTNLKIKNVFFLMEWAELFSLNKKFDSAAYYYSHVDTSSDIRTLRFYLSSTGEYYIARKRYDKALPNLVRSLNYNKKANDRNQVMRSLVTIAKTHLALQNIDSAFKYAHEALAIAKQTGARLKIKDACEILSSIHAYWQSTDSAYFYLQQYTRMNDSLLNDQVKGKLAAYSFEQKIELLNKEKEIQHIQLQKQSLLKNILIGSIIFLLTLAAIIFRIVILKRRNEKQRLEHELELQRLGSEMAKAELQQQATELEMQAFRAQMNPHFIFNSLNAINRFILQNNKEQASEYLTKFSKLVRTILQNSQSSLITLESELESLELYLCLEVLRFDDHFDYRISVADDVDISILKVPPLIIQPYAENAIWHGLMHKEAKGHLEVEIWQNDKWLYFKITDNGIGRKQAAALASKSANRHRSFGMSITEHRISIFQNANAKESPIAIQDLAGSDGDAAGTEVIIKLPVIYD